MEIEISKAELKANEMLKEAQNVVDNGELVVDKSVNLENELQLEESKNTKEFTKIVENVLDKGINYAIKALPIADGIKDIALDVKEALKTNDFKEILKTAVGSSIREGLEYLNMPVNILKDIKSVQKIAFSGGLSKALSAGIDIFYNKFFKNNLFGSMAKDFISSIKAFINSNDFCRKVKDAFDKLEDKVKKFNSMCKNWYEAYEKFDIENINTLSKEISKKVRDVSGDIECIKENKLIQNITSMINNTKDKLSVTQMEACKIV